MLSAIKKFFDQNVHIADAALGSQSEDHAIKVASVSLLLEMARADYQVGDEELEAVADSARQMFDLTEEETQQIVELAEQHANDATCYFEFTSLINREFSPPQKIKLVEMLWHIAYSDKHLQKYEEAMVRKVADLIYVAHGDFIAAKLRVKERLGVE